MPRLDATPGILGFLLFFSVASWWLAALALQSHTGFTTAPALADRAAAVAILLQWVVVAGTSFFAPVQQENPGPRPYLAEWLPALTIVLSLWPLLVVLWKTSELSALALVESQLIAILIAAIAITVNRKLRKLRLNPEYQDLLSTTASVVMVVAVWLNHDQLLAWISL